MKIRMEVLVVMALVMAAMLTVPYALAEDERERDGRETRARREREEGQRRERRDPDERKEGERRDRAHVERAEAEHRERAEAEHREREMRERREHEDENPMARMMMHMEMIKRTTPSLALPALSTVSARVLRSTATRALADT